MAPNNTLPYNAAPYSLLGFALTIIGLALLSAGIVVSVHYARERGWYMKEIHKAHSVEETRLNIQRKLSSEQSYEEQELKTKKKKT